MAPAGTPGFPGRGLAAALLAFVLGLTAMTWFVASANFRIVDPEKSPRTREVFSSIEGDEARLMATRYLASESNRAMFQFVGPMQLAAVATATLLFFLARARGQTPRDRFLFAGLAVLLVLATVHAFLVPVIVRQGRAIDFVSRLQGDPPEVRQFLLLHVVYVVMDLVKAVLLVLLVPFLLRSTRGVPAAGSLS